MKADRRQSIEVDARRFLPLTHLSFEVLLALAGSDRHGYGIVKEIERRSAGVIAPGTGTLYVALHRLLEDGLIEESDRRPAKAGGDDARRRYYRLAPLGRAVAQAEAERLAASVDAARANQLLPARDRPANGSARS
jgi:DNA-binding PadR family transcriptional regulator